MKTPRRRIQKARRREEKITARVARWAKMLDRRPGSRASRIAAARNGARAFMNAPDTVSPGSLVSRGDGANAVVLADAANAREVVGFVLDVLSPTECLVGDTLTPYQRRIVERLRSAGQVVVVVPSRYASTTPCDYDPSDDTKGALNVHAAATGEGR